MKHKTVIFVVLVLTALVPFALAQDTTSNSSTAPSSQSTATSNQTASANNTSSKAGANDGDLTQQLQSKFSQDPAFANVQISVTNQRAMLT